MRYYVGDILCDPNYMEHHGIKGQKWGVRRFQNYDGTRTALGKQRYGSAAAVALSVAIPTAITLTTIAVQEIKNANANSRLKRTEERIARQPLDEKTGLHLKGNVVFTEMEDIKEVNPAYKNFNADTKHNCMNCSFTYELRQRGYDTTADLRETGRPSTFVETLVPTSKIETDTKRFNPYTSDAAKDSLKMLKEQPPGTRGIINVTWKGSISGHSMAYRIDEKGKLIIIDAQSGNKITGGSINSLVSTCSYLEFARLDDKEFDIDVLKSSGVCH